MSTPTRYIVLAVFGSLLAWTGAFFCARFAAVMPDHSMLMILFGVTGILLFVAAIASAIFGGYIFARRVKVNQHWIDH